MAHLGSKGRELVSAALKLSLRKYTFVLSFSLSTVTNALFYDTSQLPGVLGSMCAHKHSMDI